MRIKKLVFISLLTLTGFFVFSQTGTTILDSIKSNNIYRKYRLYVPLAYNSSTPAPLVFNLHGYTSNALSQQLYSNFMPIADTAKFLMVLPEGTLFNGNQYWNAGFGPGANDLLYMNDLIDSLNLTYNIDNNRIYSCGMSNGGIMSYYLACNASNRFAAIASVTGSMLNSWFSSSPPRPVPVMEIHGTNDATVPYNGDATFAHIDSVVKKWARHNSCLSSPLTTSVTNVNTTDGATAIHYRYTGGTNNADVELYKVINGGHTWPGAPIAIGVTCMDFNASAEIWRFFSKYKLNLLTTIDKHELANEPLIYPNPANSYITIKTQETDLAITVFNSLGEIVRVPAISNNTSYTLSLNDLSNGVYILRITNSNKQTVQKKFIKN